MDLPMPEEVPVTTAWSQSVSIATITEMWWITNHFAFKLASIFLWTCEVVEVFEAGSR
jgi:hypothetical protein